MDETPNPQKYDAFIINKYSVSKRLKAIKKHKEKN